MAPQEQEACACECETESEGTGRRRGGGSWAPVRARFPMLGALELRGGSGNSRARRRREGVEGAFAPSALLGSWTGGPLE